MPALTVDARWRHRRRSPSYPPSCPLDIAHRNQIARQHLGLVRQEAHRMARKCAEPYEDLEQIGQLGLLRAIERFDAHKGVAFSSFAVPFIRGAMQHFLRDHWGSAKIPRRNVEMASQVRRTQRRLKALGREMSEIQVAIRLGISAEKWRWTAEALRRRPALDVEELKDLIPAPEAAEPADDLRDRLYAHLGALPNPHRACLIAHFFGNLSPASIAAHSGRSPAEVEALIQEAMQWLKGHLEADCG
jgi:RNA polymerase sigma-B factor